MKKMAHIKPILCVFGALFSSSGYTAPKKMAHIKPILCVFGTPFYSSGYTAPAMHHQQVNIIQTTRAGAWPVWLIWKVPAALLLSRRAPIMLVGAGNELGGFKAAFPCTTHTHHFPFVHRLNIQSKASMQKRSKNNAKKAPKLHHFSQFFSLYAVAVGGGAAIWLRRRPWHTEWELAAELGGRAKMVASPWTFRRCQSS
jgi:hypothetical protein